MLVVLLVHIKIHVLVFF